MGSVDWKKLFDEARSVRTRAHAPYSHFMVGAALLTAEGQVFAGCNMENASYGLSVCAERNTLAQMVAQGGNNIVALAVVADSIPPTPPCGACRQVIAEFAPPTLPIRIQNLAGHEEAYLLSDLLPHAFTRSFL